MGRAIDQCQFHRPVEKPRALGRRLWLPKQRSDSGRTVLAASTIPCGANGQIPDSCYDIDAGFV
jgi:hypothetical protein